MRKQYPTMHAWRSAKRKEARALKKAVDAMRQGSAFLPHDTRTLVWDIDGKIDAIVQGLSVAKWGQ